MKHLMFIFWVVAEILREGKVEGGDCIRKEFGHGSFVCVCNSSHCDDLSPTEAPRGRQRVYLISSSKDDLRWHSESSTFDVDHPQRHFSSSSSSSSSFSSSPDVVITVDEGKRFQKMLGFGGAFTDAFGINLRSVSSRLQDRILESYFGANGLEYNLGRVPIAGTDFSDHAYSYDDLPPGQVDPSLKWFSLTSDDFKYKIPYIKKAKKKRGANLYLYGSPWSAPSWMKTNQKLNGDGSLKRDFYSTYANYILRFLEEYKKRKIEFFAVTTQNEPTAGLFSDYAFNEMAWMPHEQGLWLGNYFGPALKASEFSDVKIFALDDQRLFLPSWILKLVEDTNATHYIDGVAVHWYWDFITSPEHLDLTHKYFPHMPILYTEACTGWAPWDFLKVIPGSWVRAESYAKNIIQNLRHWVVGWTDWNMALNMEGGPNWAHNFVDSPILINAEKGEAYKQPMYYALAHFSKVIPEGSVRTGSKITGTSGVDAVSFVRPDGSSALIVINRNHSPLKFQLRDAGRTFTSTIGSKTIMSILWRN